MALLVFDDGQTVETDRIINWTERFDENGQPVLVVVLEGGIELTVPDTPTNRVQLEGWDPKASPGRKLKR
jgi:hypothetical protein